MRIDLGNLIIVGLVALVGVGIAGQKTGLIPTEISGDVPQISDENNVVVTVLDDPKIIQATELARVNLDQFLAASANPPASWSNLSIKVALQSSGPVENIWLSNFGPLNDGRWAGDLSNKPQYLPGLNLGDRVEFEHAKIVDWAFIENGKGYGFYSVRALLDEVVEEERAGLIAFLAEPPLPASWTTPKPSNTGEQSATVTKVFDAMRWGLGFKSS